MRFTSRLLAAVAALLAVVLVSGGSASAKPWLPWTIDPHPPIVAFVPCASAPDYPFGPTCATPALQQETRERILAGHTVQAQTRYKLWYYLGSDGGAVIVDPASEGFYASRWSRWRTVPVG